MANTKAHLEWDPLQTRDFVMEELNWRVIGNRMKGQKMSAHDVMFFWKSNGTNTETDYTKESRS
jgi:hypothetical protein